MATASAQCPGFTGHWTCRVRGDRLEPGDGKIITVRAWEVPGLARRPARSRGTQIVPRSSPRRSDVLHFHQRRSLRDRMGSAPSARTSSGVFCMCATSGLGMRQSGSSSLGNDRPRSRRNLIVGRTRVRGESAMPAIYKAPTTILSLSNVGYSPLMGYSPIPPSSASFAASKPVSMETTGPLVASSWARAWWTPALISSRCSRCIRGPRRRPRPSLTGRGSAPRGDQRVGLDVNFDRRYTRSHFATSNSSTRVRELLRRQSRVHTSGGRHAGVERQGRRLAVTQRR